ncbi:hypothetical protein AHAS_Ahas12G0041700 [Arachis hypogaea]
MDQRSEEESMQSGEHMKKPKIWILSSMRMRTLRTCVDRKNSRDEHAQCTLVAFYFSCNSFVLLVVAYELSFVDLHFFFNAIETEAITEHCFGEEAEGSDWSGRQCGYGDDRVDEEGDGDNNDES